MLRKLGCATRTSASASWILTAADKMREVWAGGVKEGFRTRLNGESWCYGREGKLKKVIKRERRFQNSSWSPCAPSSISSSSGGANPSCKRRLRLVNNKTRSHKFFNVLNLYLMLLVRVVLQQLFNFLQWKALCCFDTST